MENKDIRHKYDYEADVTAWEKKHGQQVYLNPPGIPLWLRSKQDEKK